MTNLARNNTWEKQWGKNKNYTLYILMAHFLLKSLEPWQTFLFSLMIYTSFSLNHACCLSSAKVKLLGFQFNLISRWPWFIYLAMPIFTWIWCSQSIHFGPHFSTNHLEEERGDPGVMWGKGQMRCPDWCYGKERDPGKMEREREKDSGLRLSLSATIDFSLSFRVHQLYLSIPAPSFPPAWAHLSIVSFGHTIPGSSFALPCTHYKNRQPSPHYGDNNNKINSANSNWALTLTSRKHWHSCSHTSTSAVALCIMNLRGQINRGK